MDFSIWAFVMPEEIAERWYFTVNQLPSRLSPGESEAVSDAGIFRVRFKDRIGFVSLGCLDSGEQLWVLEASGQFSPIFHWYLRYLGATCVPKSFSRDTCSSVMFAHLDDTRRVDWERKNGQVGILQASPFQDIAIYSQGNELLKYRLHIAKDLCLVFSDRAPSREQDASVATRLGKCTDTVSDVTFDDIWRFRHGKRARHRRA